MARSIRRIYTRPTVSDKSRALDVVNALGTIYRGLTRLESLTITPTEANIVKEMIGRYNAFTDLDTVDDCMTVLSDRENDYRDQIVKGLEFSRESIIARRKVLESVGVQHIAELLSRENRVHLSTMIAFLAKLDSEPKSIDSKPYTLAEMVREIADGRMGESEYDYSPGCEDAPMLRQVFSWYFETGQNATKFKNRLLEDLTVLASDAERAAEYVHANWHDMLVALARSEWNEVKPDPVSGIKFRIAVVKAVRSVGYGGLREAMQFLTDIGIV